MKNIMKVEWYKLIRKKDVCILSVLFFMVPILMSLCLKYKIVSIDLTGASEIAIPDYAVAVWEFMKMLFFPYLIIAYIAISSLGKEVEQKTISIELLKSSRKNVVLSKIILCTILSIVEVLLMFVSGIIGAMILNNTVKQTFQPCDGDWSFVMMIIIQMLAMILLVSFANLIGTFCGNLKSILIVLGTIILQKVLASVNFLENIMPVSLLAPSNYLSNLTDLSTTAALKYNIGIIAYVLGLIIIINAITYIVWKKRDFM